MLVFRVLLLTVFVLCSNVNGQSYENLTRLKSTLLQRYTKSNRPVRNQSDILSVYVSVFCRLVKEFNIVESLLGTHLFFDIQWTDEYMRWDSVDYDNITTVNFSILDVWVPPMVLINPADKYGLLGNENENLLVEYSSDGNASLVFAAYVMTTCKPYVKYFPFDSHTCHIMISSIGYGTGNVIPKPLHLYTNYLVDNGQWVMDILNLTEQWLVPGLNDSQYVDLSITLSRRPHFLLLNLFIPIAFLVCMNLFVFFLPAECGEKASYSITVLLSLAIFMTIVMDQLPPLSTDVPVVSVILCVHLANNVIVCTCTILSLNYHHRSNTRKISCHLRLLTMLVTWRIYKGSNKVENTFNGEPTEERYPKADEKDVDITETDDVTNRVTTLQRTDQRPVLTWQNVSHAMDRWNFFICIMMTVLEMGLVFYHSASGM
ncbi:acetylcholine receptor subunit beta-like [Ylistrum balloti]|uniref:acetylcholine receptor subunit beta-like n=1 Tax=Ylistrum balloti TaxID=509963 RepID=UPI002905F5A3|nr:acetylcholine receptor subunit beta-like [Ylistrum balloti]